jgi:hypothetical protein
VSFEKICKSGQVATEGVAEMGGVGMRLRLIVVVALGAAFALASTGSAQASVGWPAKCSNFKCVNAHLNQLHKQAAALKARVVSDEGFETTGLVCEGDALVNETQNEADNATGITGEVAPIATKLGIDCPTAWWAIFDPSLYPVHSHSGPLAEMNRALVGMRR